MRAHCRHTWWRVMHNGVGLARNNSQLPDASARSLGVPAERRRDAGNGARTWPLPPSSLLRERQARVSRRVAQALGRIAWARWGTIALRLRAASLVRPFCWKSEALRGHSLSIGAGARKARPRPHRLATVATRLASASGASLAADVSFSKAGTSAGPSCFSVDMGAPPAILGLLYE